MAKKDKSIAKQHVTKRRLARWEREKRRRRIYTSAGILIIAIVAIVIVYGFYTTEISMESEWVTEVGGTRFVGTDYADALHLCQLGFFGNASGTTKEAPISVIEQNEVVKLGTVPMGITVNDTEVDTQIRSAIEGNQSLTDEQFQQSYQRLLANMSLSDQKFRQVMANTLLQGKLYEYLLQGLPQVGQNVSQIYLEALAANESQLSDVLAKVDSGEHLADLKANYSYTEIGWVPRGVLATVIDDVAFNLSIGNVSDPMLIGNASYYLLEVTAKGERPIDEAMREQLEYNLLPRWIMEKSEEYNVERNPGLDLDKMYNWALDRIGAVSSGTPSL
jgi:parvulin-like peptidyl-prolyl isomerase